MKYAPNWVYDLIGTLDEYEDEHGSHDDEGWHCFRGTLAAIPEQELDRARAIANYSRQQRAAEPNECSEGCTQCAAIIARQQAAASAPTTTGNGDTPA